MLTFSNDLNVCYCIWSYKKSQLIHDVIHSHPVINQIRNGIIPQPSEVEPVDWTEANPCTSTLPYTNRRKGGAL